MQVFKDNIVGLLRFIWILRLMFFPTKPPDRLSTAYPEEPKGLLDKYRAILGHDSEPLSPTETKFCPKCHVSVAQVRRTKRGTEIIQNGKVLVTVGSNVTIQAGKKMRGFPITCPNGHTVRIE